MRIHLDVVRLRIARHRRAGREADGVDRHRLSRQRRGHGHMERPRRRAARHEKGDARGAFARAHAPPVTLSPAGLPAPLSERGLRLVRLGRQSLVSPAPPRP